MQAPYDKDIIKVNKSSPLVAIVNVHHTWWSIQTLVNHLSMLHSI